MLRRDERARNDEIDTVEQGRDLLGRGRLDELRPGRTHVGDARRVLVGGRRRILDDDDVASVGAQDARDRNAGLGQPDDEHGHPRFTPWRRKSA